MKTSIDGREGCCGTTEVGEAMAAAWEAEAERAISLNLAQPDSRCTSIGLERDREFQRTLSGLPGTVL